MTLYAIQKWMTRIIPKMGKMDDLIQNWMIFYTIQKWMTTMIQNWMIIVLFCSSYIATNELKSSKMIITSHEKIWMITDGQLWSWTTVHCIPGYANHVTQNMPMYHCFPKVVGDFVCTLTECLA